MTTGQDVEYRQLAAHPGYRFGSDGSVWSRRLRGHWKWPGETRLGDKWRTLKPWVHRCGHLFVNLGGKQRYVHRLIAEAFIGECPEGHQCCHNDGNPGNNAVHNLRWDTPKANATDAKIHGVTRVGESHGMAKLSAAQVGEIRRRSGKESVSALAAEFGVHRCTIGRAIRGENWKCLRVLHES